MADTTVARDHGTLLIAALLLPLWACGGGTPEAESAEGSSAADTVAAAAAEAETPPAAEEPAPEQRRQTRSDARPPTQRRTPPAEEQPSPTVEATLPAGTEFPVTLNDSLDTRSLEAGQRFTASVSQAVATDTRVVIPSGATVIGRVTEVRQPKADSVGMVVLAVDSVRVGDATLALQADVVDAEVQSRSEMTDEAAKIGGGAAAGALIGAIAGKDVKSAIIGAAGGAAAGTAIAMGTKQQYGVLPEGATLRLRTREALTVTVPR